MKILSVQAHFDDFEFTAAGTFLLWKQKLGPDLRARILVCTDGKAGHHFRTRAETGRLRLHEQQAAARLGGFEFEMLRLPNGRVPREACLQVGVPLLAALWKSIREFEPDYLFCPPIPADPLAGIHVDHAAVAEAVRKVAYMINVPHAFTPEYPADETRSRPCKVPVILNVFDPYMADRGYDLAVDVETAFPTLCAMSWCHQSQINEWLPWVNPAVFQPCRTPADWTRVLRRRCLKRNQLLGIKSRHAFDIFTLTSWGSTPAPGHPFKGWRQVRRA